MILNRQSSEKTVERIAGIIHNRPLASAIYESAASARECPFLYMAGGNTVWGIFKRSLDTAIRDIEKHPRGKLFRRFIEYGPHHPEDPEYITDNFESTLSDREAGSCVQFIFSHMINRFKGELAELLAIEPCLELIYQLQREGTLPKSVNLYWGDMLQERYQVKNTSDELNTRWGNFTKGADGLIVERISARKADGKNVLKIHGVVEVKSMTLYNKKIINQINRHISRLNGGVKLGGTIWADNKICISTPFRIIVVPATWKLNREWRSVKTNLVRKIVLAEPAEPPVQMQVEKLQPDLWRIKLPWSQELLNQAAYEMTFWYMSQVGKHIYSKKNLPEEWKDMTPEEAGYNAIKMMLYYIPLRYLSERQVSLAIKLYNVYSFGYPVGIDSKEMLWPEDLCDNAQEQTQKRLLNNINTIKSDSMA